MAIQFFPTKDPGLLAQYYELRSRMFRRHYPGLPAGFGNEETTDHGSEIVVGVENRVVAGGRITVSRPGAYCDLPMEEGGLRLPTALPGFHLDRTPYAEFSRVAVEQVYAASRSCSLGLILELAHVTAQMGVDLVFSICPDAQVRWNAANSRKARVRFETFPLIDLHTPYGIPMTLCAYSGLLAADYQRMGISA